MAEWNGDWVNCCDCSLIYECHEAERADGCYFGELKDEEEEEE